MCGSHPVFPPKILVQKMKLGPLGLAASAGLRDVLKYHLMY